MRTGDHRDYGLSEAEVTRAVDLDEPLVTTFRAMSVDFAIEPLRQGAEEIGTTCTCGSNATVCYGEPNTANASPYD
jgi:hypothetical protein